MTYRQRQNRKKGKLMMADAMKDVLLQDGNDTCMVAMIATDKAGGKFVADPRIPPQLLREVFERAKQWTETLVEVKPGYWIPARETDEFKRVQ